MKDLIAMYRKAHGLEPEVEAEPTVEEQTDSRRSVRLPEKAQHVVKTAPVKIWNEEDLDQKIDRTFTRQEVDELRQTYRRKDNGAHVWQAYRLLRETGLPLQEWILEYMDDAAGKLAEVRGGKEAPAEAYDALRFSGSHKGNARAERQYLDTVALLQVYAAELDRMERNAPDCCTSKEKIYQRMHEAGLGVSPGAIKKRLLELL